MTGCTRNWLQPSARRQPAPSRVCATRSAKVAIRRIGSGRFP